MRYKPGIMVSVISIFEAFEFVAFKTAFDYLTFAWKLCSLPYFTLVVDITPNKWVTLRDRFATGRSSSRAIVPFPTILVTFHTLSPYLLGFLGVLTQDGIVPHFMGRRG
jgi:hypothetical protein